jgi:uncharacterized coiled-coil protein SlyX
MDDEETIDRLNGEIASLNTQITGLNTQITGLGNTIIQKDSEIAGKQTEIAGKQTEINNLNTQITGLNSQISAKDLVIATHTSTIRALNARITELETQLAAAGGEEDHYRARQVADFISPVERNADDGDVTGVGMFSMLPAELMGGGTGEDEFGLLDRLTVDPGGDHTLDDDALDDEMLDDEGENVDDSPSPYMSGAAPPALSDEHATWRGATLVEELTGGSDSIVYVYSDVEASTREKFGDAYGMLGGTAPSSTIDVTDPMIVAEYEKALKLYRSTVETTHFMDHVAPGSAKYEGATEVETDGSAAEFWKLAASSDFLPPFGAGTASEQSFDEEGTVDGRFDGVSGTFTCLTAAGCIVTNSREDGLSSTGNWRFVADDPEATVTARRPDGDYIAFGWWLEKPDAEEGTHSFAPFYAGRDPFVANEIADLDGTAKYEGPAAGKYAKRSRGSNEAEAGIFRADATLTADFDDNNAVSGTVDTFVGEDGQSLGEWNVELVAGTTSDNTFTGTVMSATSRADGRPWETGAWEGRFYGNNDDSGYPGSVAGMFHARWGTSDMAEVETDEVGFVGVGGSYGAHYVAPPAEDE